MAEISLADALTEVRFAIATDSRDWGLRPNDAFLWGVLVGWECEETHGHDEFCSEGALAELASRHGWRRERVEQIRAMRHAIQQATDSGSGLGATAPFDLRKEQP